MISKIFNIAFCSVWKRCFSPVVLKVFSQNTCLDQLYVIFNFEVWQYIYTVPFLHFLSVSSDLSWGYYFKACCCKTNVCNYRRYQSLTWKFSNFFEWPAFGCINTESIVFICSDANFDYLLAFKSRFFVFVDYQKKRWDC